MNISVDKFYKSDYLEEDYDRQILIGLMLHSFKYSKHIVADPIINFTLSKAIFNQLEVKHEYFSPIDLYTWADVHSNILSVLNNKFPADIEDELVKEYAKYNIFIAKKDVFEYKKTLFKSTFVEEFVRSGFENKVNLLNSSNRVFTLGDMFIDAAMCCTGDQEVINKVQSKYAIDSLVGVLNIDDQSFHYLEAVVWLIRACYSEQVNNYLSQLKKGIYYHLDRIKDLNNIGQLWFAIEWFKIILNSDELVYEQKLNTCISTFFLKLFENFNLYAKPNAFDFIKDSLFLNQNLILRNNWIVDNEYDNRDVVVEIHQKELLISMCRLIRRFKLNVLPITAKYFDQHPKDQDLVDINKGNEQQCWQDKGYTEIINILNDKMTNITDKSPIFSSIIIVWSILKYVDIPFDEWFTDELIDMLMNGTSHAFYQLDNDFVEFGKQIQQAIVSIHNYELNSHSQHLVNIKDFAHLLSKLRHRLKYQGDVRSLKGNQINFGNIDDAKIALILWELLYKIKWNSSSKSLRQNKNVNELLVSIYKTLGLLIYKRQDVWTMIWCFSQNLFSISWWNNILNRLHAEFVLVWVSRLGADKTTLYSVNLLAKACKSIGDILNDELKKELSNDQDNEPLKKLLDLIEQIGTEWEGEINFNFPNSWNIFNYLNSTDVDSAINRFSNQIMMRKTEDQGKLYKILFRTKSAKWER